MFFSLFFTVRAGLLLCFRFCQGSVNVPSYFAQGRMTLRYAMSQGRVLSCANGCVTSIQFAIYDKQSVVRYVNFSFFSILRAFLGSVIFFPRFFCFFLAICGIWIHVGFLMRDGLPPIWVVYVERLGVYEAFVCTRGVSDILWRQGWTRGGVTLLWGSRNLLAFTVPPIALCKRPLPVRRSFGKSFHRLLPIYVPFETTAPR